MGGGPLVLRGCSSPLLTSTSKWGSSFPPVALHQSSFPFLLRVSDLSSDGKCSPCTSFPSPICFLSCGVKRLDNRFPWWKRFFLGHFLSHIHWHLIIFPLDCSAYTYLFVDAAVKPKLLQVGTYIYQMSASLL